MTGNTVKEVVFERMRQAIGRLVRDGAGDALDGEIVLTVVGGQLVDVLLPGHGRKEDAPKEKLITDDPPSDLRLTKEDVQSAIDELSQPKQKKPRA